MKYFLIGVGGFLGSIARFWVGGAVGARTGTGFPYGTFAVNMSGCFLIGLIVTVLTEKAHWNRNWSYLVPIGFIGAYTTFSTFEYETLRGLQDGEWLRSILYVTLSVSLGFLAVWLGVGTGRAVT